MKNFKSSEHKMRQRDARFTEVGWLIVVLGEIRTKYQTWMDEINLSQQTF